MPSPGDVRSSVPHFHILLTHETSQLARRSGYRCCVSSSTAVYKAWLNVSEAEPPFGTTVYLAKYKNDPQEWAP